MRLLLVVVLILSLTGCMKEVVYKDRMVEKPVVVFAMPPLAAETKRDELPVFELPKDSSDDALVRATAESILILLNHEKQLKEAVTPFQEKPKDAD